jgi:hypothetical protein
MSRWCFGATSIGSSHAPSFFLLFLYQLIDEHLRKFLRWLLVAQTLFAVFGILAATLGVSLIKLGFAYNFIVFCTFVASGLFLVASNQRSDQLKHFSHEIRVFLAGFLVWGLFVVHANLLGLRILTGPNVEFLGFLVFVACLGYISAYRTFANEAARGH